MTSVARTPDTLPASAGAMSASSPKRQPVPVPFLDRLSPHTPATGE